MLWSYKYNLFWMLWSCEYSLFGMLWSYEYNLFWMPRPLDKYHQDLSVETLSLGHICNGQTLPQGQAFCFTHRMSARCVAPVGGHFGRSRALLSSESLALYDSVPMTGNPVLFR